MPSVDEIVGHNGYQYRVKKDWVAASDQKLPLKDCHEMVIAANGLLYMLGNETTNNVIIFNKDGKVMGSWGHDYPGGHGLTLHNENGEEFLYITDTARSIVAKTTLAGKVVMEIPYPKEISAYENAAAYKPTETLIMPNGDIYVTDGYGLQFVIQYNSKGEYIRHFGGRGDGPSNLDCAHGIALDNRNADKNILLVTSRNQNAFKQFSLTGEYLGTIDMPGSFVCRPVVKGNNIYAAVFRSGDNQNFGSGYLTILDEHNQVISSPGATEPIYENGVLLPQQKLAGHFIHPHDVCVDDDENLYVPQWNSNQVYPVKLIRV
ncbi:6-bladed beta-propeller [Pedobacter frigiditerrae]|uniref:6-bladed beta-propeller n=1 Tax=Pedobacter frigiditerrae TaxID=2530452 RepID=UPI00292FF168|nr:6-bladed beta-propeller [Pedobacter frigiditerrae]